MNSSSSKLKTFVPEYLSNVRSWHVNLPFAFDLVQVLRPSVIVELGTHYGDSYFTFCQSVVENQLTTRCFAVDHWKGDEHSGYYNENVFEQVQKYNRTHYFEFSSLVRKRFDEALLQFEDNSINLLHIDGHHSYKSIKNDFENWIPKVTKHGIVLIHDTLVQKNNFGVQKFWIEISKLYPTFNLEFSFGLGILKNCPKEQSEDLIKPKFDKLIRAKYYENLGFSLLNNSQGGNL